VLDGFCSKTIDRESIDREEERFKNLRKDECTATILIQFSGEERLMKDTDERMDRLEEELAERVAFLDGRMRQGHIKC